MKWEKFQLKDITINLDNKRKPLNEQQRSLISKQKLYPYVGANNVMGYVDEFLFDEEIICVAEDGGSWGPNQKCCVHINEKCWVNNHAHVLKANGRADLKFLMYYLNTTDLTPFVTGSTRGKLTKSALESIQIPLPPLAEQKRIAALLDAADALRRKDQALLQQYDALAQAIFIDMFGDPVRNERGWEVATLSDLIWVDTQAVNPSTLTDNYYVGLEHIEKESGVLSYSSSSGVVSNKFKFTPDHILYGKLRPYLNKVAVPDCSGICSTDIFPLLPKEKGMRRFLASILRSDDFVNYANTNAVGANLPRVNKEVLLKYRTIHPPINLIDQYNKNVSVLDGFSRICRSQLGESNGLFQSLLQQSFRSASAG